MTLYHVNPETGNPGECNAKVRCPFGGEDEHFTSAGAARAAYERAQSASEDLSGEEVAKSFGIATAASRGLRLDGYTTHRLQKALERSSLKPEAKKAIEDELRFRNSSLVKPEKSVARKVKLPLPTTFKEFENAIEQTVPDVEDSKLIKPPKIEKEQYSNRYIGAKAGNRVNEDGTTKYIGQTEAAAEMRAAIKEAKRIGELPDWVDVSVKKNTGAWVSSMTVKIGIKRGAQVRAFPREWVSRNANVYHPGDSSLQSTRLFNYVSTLLRQWESSYSDHFDNYQSSHAPRVSWRDPSEDEWADRQKAKR